ncbi:MAG TPA: YggS family pyridoxal phosphate-dependent enzyme [Actinomycetales bacterium]|nr:YggS family pyridoxal phosphate-dependent enzyme [Actinomycetales bacterium]
MTARLDEDGRREELARNLHAVRQRVEKACAAAGRDPADVTTVVVTKTFPSADARLLWELGVRDVAENRDQEAKAKVVDLRDLRDLRWHFVGQLQTNKAGSVARYADVVHSVDRLRLVTALDRGAEAAGRRLGCLVQISLDGDTRRGGVAAEGAPEVAAAVAAADHLTLLGVMAVAPLGEDPAAAFRRLAGISNHLRADHPDAAWISAGMSGDLEQAVAAGATHLRVGAAVLGSRPPLR